MAPRPTPSPTPTSGITIAPFQPSTGGSAAGTSGGTSNKTSESVSKASLGGGFTLTGGAMSGITTPDRIDNERNNIQITTNVGVSTLPPEQLAVLQAQLLRAGLTPSTYTPTGTLDDVTKDALLELKRTAASTGMSDMQTLQTSINTQAEVAAAGGAAGTTGGPSTSVNRTITEPQFTDPVTVRAMFRDVLTQRLGREPTADEYHQARKLIGNSEGGQDITTTRTHTNGEGKSTTRVTRSDDTTDPSPQVLLDDMSRRGALGREANTVRAASFMDIIARRVGG